MSGNDRKERGASSRMAEKSGVYERMTEECGGAFSIIVRFASFNLLVRFDSFVAIVRLDSFSVIARLDRAI